MAGRSYVVVAGQSQAASSTETNIEIAAGSADVISIDRHRISQDTHTTSEQYAFRTQRVTTTGTGTAYTALPKMAGDAGTGATVEINSSVEPTYTGTTFLQDTRWNSLTGRDIVYPPGRELFVAPSALIGMAVVTPAGTTTFTPAHEVEFTEFG